MENISNSSTVEADRYQRVRISNRIYRFVIVFLLFFITVVSFLVIGVVKKLSYIPEDISSVLLDTIVCSSCDTETIEENTPLKNDGWSKHEYPEEGFSVELPSHSYFSTAFNENPTDRLVWSIYAYEKDETEFNPDVFFYFEKRINISFFPIETPSDAACGGGCLGESNIRVDFYKNIEKLNIEDVKDLYITYITDLQKELGDTEIYDIKLKNMQGYEAFDYEYKAGMGEFEGYVILTDEYIADVSKNIFSTGENLEIVNKVVDSIYFE